MDNIKFLQVNALYFRLPDNFNGTSKDAFRLLADYMEQKGAGEKNHEFSDEDSAVNLYTECWNKFAEIYPHKECKFVGAFGVTERINGSYNIID